MIEALYEQNIFAIVMMTALCLVAYFSNDKDK